MTRGTDSPQPDTTSSSSSAILTTTTTDPVAPTSTVPPGVSEDFATNLAARSQLAAERLLDITAPESPARSYVDHQIAALSVLPDQPLGRVDESAGGDFVVCDPKPTGGTCRTFSKFTVDADGLLTEFEIDDEPLDGRLLVGGRSGIDESVTVTVISAYRTIPMNNIIIVVDVTNQADDAMLVNGFAAVHRSSDGAEFEVTAVLGTDEVRSEDTGRLLLVFAGGTIGGVVTLPISTADFATAFEITVELLEP